MDERDRIRVKRIDDVYGAFRKDYTAETAVQLTLVFFTHEAAEDLSFRIEQLGQLR